MEGGIEGEEEDAVECADFSPLLDSEDWRD